MIPVKLTMRNFMCYRENVPPLYFSSIHTACISGSNGNGKSAIVDAITWALWGQSRAASDDELVYASQTEMEVEFEFEFTVSGQLYRIIRKHSKPKTSGRSGQTILELQTSAGSAGSPQAGSAGSRQVGEGFKPITGDSITQTQQKIIQLLHMDYDTFINSAFLRQGHADEFTKKRPGERKQVLASILQLAVYDELEEEARNRAKKLESDASQLISAIKDIDDELARKTAYETELERAQGELSQAEKQTAEQEAKLASLRQQKELLESKRTQLSELESRMKDADRNRSRWEEQIRQHLIRIKQYELVIASRVGIESGYSQFIVARKECQELDGRLKVVSALRERTHRLDMAIHKASSSLITEHAVTENKIRELETSLQKLPRLMSELQQAQSQLQSLAETETRLQEKKQSVRDLRTKVNYLEAEVGRLKREIAEIEEKLALLSTRGGEKCPLCESELGPEGRQRIEVKYIAEKEQKAGSLNSNRADLTRRETELKSFEAEIAQFEAKLNRDKASVQAKVAVLSKSISEADEARSQLGDARKTLQDNEQRQASRQFAVTEQLALAQLESEIAKQDYDEQKHEDVRVKLAALEPFEPQKRKLEEADRLIVQEKESAARAEATVQELRQSLESDNQKKQELAVLLKAYPQLITDLRQAEAFFQSLLARQKQAQETVGGVKARLERCAELEVKRKEKQEQLKQAEEQEKIYKELAQAFGKKGIQAMLIEIAIPEIENEANKLLARMTDNRMNVKIETQRATKKGDVVETLDINISDELGTRNYEMFSGGEAFRIDFAIRIAMSRLLAHRAGAPLPTLIIDEGFGTQDSAGIEKLKEAINSIQDDFEKILVITHIAELRDAFPTRIEVVKTDGGSTLFLS